MSKYIVWIVVVIAVAGAAAGAFQYFRLDERPPASAPSRVEPEATLPPAVPKPTPDHGDFHKRFQPSMPSGK